MISQWQPYREPLRATLLRTGTIAIVLGFVLSRWWGGLSHWPMAILVMLWPSFGGHWIEVWFLNWLRPRISGARPLQIAARIAVWFVAGNIFAIGMALTAASLTGFRLRHWPAWWLCGLAFIGVELVAHLVMLLRGEPNFYNGRG